MTERPIGRPDAGETKRRTQEFIRLVLAGEAFDVAAKQARVKDKRALHILSQPEMRQLLAIERAA